MSMYPNAPLLYLYVLIFPNGKRYAGASHNWKRRWVRNPKKAKTPVQKAIKHFGIKNVILAPLAFGERTYILEMERRAIAKWKLQDIRFGYNCTPGGDESPMHVPEIAAKVSAKNKGKALSAEAYQNLLKALARPEYKALRSKLMSGRSPSPEAREKMRQAHLGVSPGNKGIPHTEEAHRKMREARKDKPHPGLGYRWTPQQRANLSLVRLGHQVSNTQREKVRQSLLGKKHTLERRAIELVGQQRRRARERAEKERIDEHERI